MKQIFRYIQTIKFTIYNYEKPYVCLCQLEWKRCSHSGLKYLCTYVCVYIDTTFTYYMSGYLVN